MYVSPVTSITYYCVEDYCVFVSHKPVFPFLCFFIFERLFFVLFIVHLVSFDCLISHHYLSSAILGATSHQVILSTPVVTTWVSSHLDHRRKAQSITTKVTPT